jgi:putative RNA 2'-phosphotransferase
LSYVLRHQPEAIGLYLDSEGWADIDTLIAQAGQMGKSLDRRVIQIVVDSNDKKRFAISEDGRRIRAVQGHSAKSVTIKRTEKSPPEFLYHGTASRFLASIYVQGLVPGSRHHVHLSQDPQTAIAVGRRHGKPIVLKIAARQMSLEGHKFFLAENGVWLTDYVPPIFLVQFGDSA